MSNSNKPNESELQSSESCPCMNVINIKQIIAMKDVYQYVVLCQLSKPIPLSIIGGKQVINSAPAPAKLETLKHKLQSRDK
jgi:hypothetical protein